MGPMRRLNKVLLALAVCFVRMMLEAAGVQTDVRTQIGRTTEGSDGLLYRLRPSDVGRRGDSVV